MSKKILVSGSIAFDVIMSFDGIFSETIDSTQKNIGAAFLVHELKKHFGGCATNISYNLRLLGEDPILLGSVGSDFQEYQLALQEIGIRTSFIKKHDDVYTAQAFITTDKSGNQLTSFYPGAMNLSHLNEIPPDDIAVAIISPDGYEGMLTRIRQCEDRSIKFLFDPGQGLPMFSKKDLVSCVEKASFIAFNEHEWVLFQKLSGLTMSDLMIMGKVVIVTLGAEGSRIFFDQNEIYTPSINVDNPLDPTGCGDAFRAGLLYGYINDLDWSDSAKVATTMGAFAVQYEGTQSHNFNKEQFNHLLYENFNLNIS
jgi:adenosine kinase